MVIDTDGNRDQIVCRWLNIPAMAWTLAAIAIYPMAFRLLKVTMAAEYDFFLLYLVVLVLCLVYSFYLAAFWLNQTRISISAETVEVSNSPVPYPGKVSLARGEIVSFYTRNDLRPDRSEEKAVYEIHAYTDRGRQNRIVSGLTSLKEAELIRRELNRLAINLYIKPAMTNSGNRRYLKAVV